MVSVHRTISTAVLQRSVTARARTALAKSIESGDVSGAAAASPGGAGIRKSTNGITVMGYPKIRLVA